MGFRVPESKNRDHFFTPTSLQNGGVGVCFIIYHFWTRNRQILNFEHFELVLACFYSVKRAFSTKWWPGEENAPKIIFFAFLVSFHINTTYIKLDWNSDNFLIFWCTLLYSL